MDIQTYPPFCTKVESSHGAFAAILGDGPTRGPEGCHLVSGWFSPKRAKIKPAEKNGTWWFQVTFLGWLSDPFKGLSDLQLGDQKVTLNHLKSGSENFGILWGGIGYFLQKSTKKTGQFFVFYKNNIWDTYIIYIYLEPVCLLLFWGCLTL